MKQLTRTTGIISVTAALLLGLVASTKADTATYTTTATGTFDFGSTPLALAQFNPGLGTLDSITISLSGNTYTALTVYNTSPSTYGTPSAVWNDVQILLGSSTFDLAVNALNPNYGNWTLPNAWLDVTSPHFNVSGLPSGDNTSFNAYNTGGSGLPAVTSSITSGTIFTDLQGIGYQNLDVYSASTVDSGISDGATFSADETVTGGITATVTYVYTPVPEPSSALFLGLGGLALACYRRFTR
jgi:hypothetical protein